MSSLACGSSFSGQGSHVLRSSGHEGLFREAEEEIENAQKENRRLSVTRHGLSEAKEQLSAEIRENKDDSIEALEERLKEVNSCLEEQGEALCVNAKAEEAARNRATVLRAELVKEEQKGPPRPAADTSTAQGPKEFLESYDLTKLSPKCPASKEIAQSTTDDTYIQLLLYRELRSISFFAFRICRHPEA